MKRAAVILFRLSALRRETPMRPLRPMVSTAFLARAGLCCLVAALSLQCHSAAAEKRTPGCNGVQQALSDLLKPDVGQGVSDMMGGYAFADRARHLETANVKRFLENLFIKLENLFIKSDTAATYVTTAVRKPGRYAGLLAVGLGLYKIGEVLADARPRC